ncbi:hypothetical protein ACFXOS_19635 [Streptomyces sp. NPDC059175]|uniref:hypothetical protein n=1 Tax=Streptomyces sp. NPDC059175 TaxID=3346757 RepID=UPI003696F354
MPAYTLRHEAIQYDGANGQHIATEFLGDVELLSDDGQTLTIGIPVWPGTQPLDIPKDYYVLRYYGRTFYQAIPPGDFEQNWVEIPDPPAA